MNNHCPKTDCPHHNDRCNEHCGAPTAEDMRAAHCPYMNRLPGSPCPECGRVHEYEIRQWGSGSVKWTVRKHDAEPGDGLSFHWSYGDLGKMEVPLAEIGFAFSEIECLTNRFIDAVEDAYREGWEDRENRQSEDCLGEAVMDACWRDSGASGVVHKLLTKRPATAIRPETAS